MPTPNGSQNQPQFDLNDDGDFAADLSTVANYAASVGNVKRGTLAQRDALTGLDLWDGLHFRDISARVTYVYAGASGAGTWLRQDRVQLLGNQGVLRGQASVPLPGSSVLFQTGNTIFTANSGGDGTLTLPAPFPLTLLSFVAMSADSSIGRFTVAVNPSGGNAAALNLHIDREASPLGISVRITWIAIGC